MNEVPLHRVKFRLRGRCRANSERISQSQPDYGLGLSHFWCDLIGSLSVRKRTAHASTSWVLPAAEQGRGGQHARVLEGGCQNSQKLPSHTFFGGGSGGGEASEETELNPRRTEPRHGPTVGAKA